MIVQRTFRPQKKSLEELIHRGSLDFDTWTSIISKIEKTYPDDIEKICFVYDSFLSEFPLCHGYWRKFAAHKAHLCKVEKAVEIFERAVQSATYCVGLWVDYCSFSMSAYEDPSDVRRLFKRAMSFVGKDYLCYPLWDKYIEFEFTQQQWSELAKIYVQTLMFPTKRLHHYYDNFKKFAAIMEEEMEQHKNCSSKLESESAPDAAFTAVKDEVSCVINSLLDPSTGSFSHKALQKYKWLGERFYQEACDLERRIHCFETNIHRPYFHMMPLDDKQLENWHHYLDFVEMQDDFDWAVKVYERCLIPCADYPEFWMRYVEFMETKGGRELANFALDRATKVFLKNMPAIHLFNARFKEQIGDRYGARAAFLWSDTELSPDFIEKVVKEANMEKRLGNFAAASSVYEKALVMAAQQQKLHSVPVLYLHFSRLKYMMTGSIDAARDIIIDGIQHVPHCKLLLEGLIYFLMMHGGLGQVDVVDTIIADAISPGSDASQGLGAKDREDLSVLYLQFVDQCGTVDDIIKAWNRHIKLFPHLLRTTSSNRLPTSGNQLLDVLMGRKKNPFPKRYWPFGDHNPDQPTQLQMQDERLSLPEKHDLHPDRVFTNQLQPEEKDDSSQERQQQLSPRIAEQGMEDESMVDKPTHDSEHQSGDDASGRTESTACELQSAEAVCEPVESTCGLAHETGEDADGPIEPSHEADAPKPMEATDGLVDQPGEDASGPIPPNHDIVHQVADDDSFSDASQKYTDSINVQQEQDHEPEQHVKPLSVDSLPLNSQEKEYGDSIPMSSYEHQSPTSDRPSKFKRAKGSPSIVSPGSTQSHDSARIQNESVKPSSVASHQNPLPEQPQPQVPTDGAGNWRHSKDTVQPSGDARSRCLGDSLNQQNQQRRVSPQQQCLPADASAQKLTSQGDSHHSLPGQNRQAQQGIQEQNWTQVGAAQGSSTTHSWPTENLQQQSFESAHHQLPASPVQAQMPEFSVQSGGQYGNAGYNQAYNQMMETYFRQQQQMVVQQHYEQQQKYMQLLQQQAQQPHQPQPHLQPDQQFPQMQHHLAQIYYQQLPQMHGQQAQLMQQQLLHAYQQQGQFYHQYMQLQGQHQQHGYQQQQPMQQQQAYQQLQQQHQMQQQEYQVEYQQPQQQQQEEGQMQHQQQITSAQTLAGNGSYYQQGQQVMSPHSARSSQSPHPQQQSQGTTPPRRAAASGSSLSPHNRQQRSRGVTPHSAGTSRRAASPYNQQRSP